MLLDIQVREHSDNENRNRFDINFNPLVSMDMYYKDKIAQQEPLKIHLKKGYLIL